jgi:hypothetical protein
MTGSEVIVKAHKAADRRMGRVWNSPQGCGCPACRMERVNLKERAQQVSDLFERGRQIIADGKA